MVSALSRLSDASATSRMCSGRLSMALVPSFMPNFVAKTTGSLYAWELERGRKSWRVPVRGGVITNDGVLAVSMAEKGLGLAYAFEPTVKEQLRTGRLRCVLEPYAAVIPGYFLYFPSRAQRSTPLRLFIEMARELAVRAA